MRATLDASITGAVLRATSRVLVEVGYVGLTVAEVARRAGVHRPAVYRRWTSKADLARDTVHETMSHLILSPSGHLDEDLRCLVHALVSPVDGHPPPALVLGAALGAPELRDVAWTSSTTRLGAFIDGLSRQTSQVSAVRPPAGPVAFDLILGTTWMLASREAERASVDGAVELLASGLAGRRHR